MKTKKKKNAAREVGEIAAAVIIAWLAYQLLAITTGTALPIVAVVSDSMYHSQPYDQWWMNNGQFYHGMGISKDQFAAFPFRNGMLRGDLIFVVNKKPKAGDVVIYQSNSKTIIHRVIELRDNGYVIKGDNNPVADEGGVPIPGERIHGRAVLDVPLLGFPRTIIFEMLRI